MLIWGQFGDSEKEKQGKTTEVNNNECQSKKNKEKKDILLIIYKKPALRRVVFLSSIGCGGRI